MRIRLTPQLVKLVQHKMDSGHYVNQSEVVCEALRLMLSRDLRQALEIKRLKADLAQGIAQADRGELIDGKKAVARVRAALKRKRMARKKRC